MTDAEFSMFQMITAIVLTLADAGCLTILYCPFMTKRRSFRKGKLLSCALVYSVYCAVSAVGIFIPEIGIFGVVLVILILALLAPILKMNRFFSAFISIVFFCFNCQVGLIGNSVLYLMNTKFAYGEQLETALQNTAYNYIIVYATETILLILLIIFMNRRLLRTEPELNLREMSYLCIVPFIGIVFGEIVNRLLFVVKDGVFFSIYADYPAFLLLIPIISVLFCAGVFATLFSYQEMVKLRDEQNRFFAMEEQVRIMRERISEVEQFHGGIRKMRHEMRNHLTNIKGLAKSGKYADIEQYISQMDESMSEYEMSEKTGNPVLDVIVNDKKNAAKRGGINFSSDFLFPRSDGFNAYDVGIIVNNLLTNAIEACEQMDRRNKYINLSGRQNRKFYMIEVTNSCEGAVRVDKDSGLPISTKENEPSLHGIGLSNVRETAQKYGGDIDIKSEQNEFCVTVLLQETNKEKKGRQLL